MTDTSRIAADLIERVLDPDDADGLPLLRQALRLLADGAPVTINQLAAAAGRTATDLQSAPAWQDIEFDGAGRIVGWGLTLNPTPHRFTVNGHDLYTWCATDTLIFPGVIGRAAHIESPCPATGTPVRLSVDPAAGVTALDPPAAVVSIPDPHQISRAKVRTDLCDPGRFFASAEAASTWQAKHPGGIVLPVTDAFEQVARPIAAHTSRA